MQITAVAVWLRLSALRLLTWNRNYNIKPREISAAQARYSGSDVKSQDAGLLKTPMISALS